MSWKIRHEGSPRSVEGLTVANVVEGLQDGQWETTDEVMGPDDTRWVAIENHPQFEELAADLEPPPPPHRPDETHLDMNPLIDVCLVLLIFFILTASYAAMQKVLDMPIAKSGDVHNIVVVPENKAKELMIKVQVRMENGRPVYKVEDQVVEARNLVSEIQRWKNATTKTTVLIDAVGVEYDAVVKIQDAAAGAHVPKIYVAVQPDEIPAVK
jgi:biopolymer transport protein ExbD